MAYALLGGQILWRAGRNLLRGQVFDENFLMSVATLGAFATGNFPEAVAVMLFYQVGEYFQDLAVQRSKKSIVDLMDIRPDFANLVTGAGFDVVSPEIVEIGSVILVKPGERVPLDGVVVEGESLMDTAALTGESIPRQVGVGDAVLSGCINVHGVLSVRVSKGFEESTVSKIIDLVENASSKKAPTEKFITKFSRFYTPVVVGLAALLAIVPPLFFSGEWSEWVHRGLILLVISCPCALVISIPLGFFGGIGAASKQGILIKGGNYLEALNQLEIVVWDKTGTLTEGVFRVSRVLPSEGVSEETLVESAAYAEMFSNHPIATSVLRAYPGVVDKERVSEYRELSGHGVSAVVDGRRVLAGKLALMVSENIRCDDPPVVGTKIHVASDGLYLGCIVISDSIKSDSREGLEALKARGIDRIVMLTGDNAQTAQAIAAQLSVNEVFSDLLPDQKVDKVEALFSEKSSKGKLAFVGDGINDAPVLARADIGIAMGGLGSDAAIEAADIVLMTDEVSKLAVAVDIARRTRRIVWQNIVLALGIKSIFLVLGAMGISGMWEAVFADVGVSLLAVLNALRVAKS